MVTQALIARSIGGSQFKIQKSAIAICRFEPLQNICQTSGICLKNIIKCRPFSTATSLIPQNKNSGTLYGSKDWKWLRQAEKFEAELYNWNQHKTRIGMTSVTCSSRVPISEETFRQMLIHLRNMCPILRMCAVPRSGKLWLAEVKDMDLDFKMESGKDLDVVVSDMGDIGFDNSPWVVRVVPEKEGYQCKVPEVAEYFPHHYHIQHIIPHSYSDASTGTMISRKMVDILEDMLAGKPIDDKVQFGELIKGDELSDKKKIVRKYLEDNPDILMKEKEKILNTKKIPLLKDAFPQPEVDSVKTINLVKYIDRSILNSFHSKCKSNSVTVSSGLLAAINTGFVEMVRDAGVSRDSYHISLNQNVNLRRYTKVPLTAMGLLVSGMNQSSYPTGNVRSTFWDHAASLYNESHDLLKNYGPLLQSVIHDMSFPPLVVEKNCRQNSNDIYDRDYSFNNMLDVTHSLHNKGKHIQVTATQSYQFQQYFNQMLFSLLTYRGVSSLTLSYVNSVLHEEVAYEIMERVLLIIRDKS